MMNSIVEEKLVSFKELEQKIFHYVCELGRDMTRIMLESYDEELAESRDTKLYRDKGKRKTAIKTVYGEVEYRRRVYQTNSCLLGSSNAKYTLLHLQIPMILRLMYGCGLRAGEAVSIKMKDVDFDAGVITLRHPKGDKQRIVPMHDTLTAILHRYCCAAGLLGIPDAFIFGIPYGAGSVPTKAVKHRFDRILRLAGIDTPGQNRHERGACLHCLRHVFAFKSFEQAEKMGIRIDNAIPYLSIYLGHERIEETQKYLKFSSEMFPNALDRFGSFTSDIFPEVDYEE